MASGDLTWSSLTCSLSPGVDFLWDTLDALWEMRELSLFSRVLHRLRHQTSVADPLETGLSGSPFPLWEKSRVVYLATCCYLYIMWYRQGQAIPLIHSSSSKLLFFFVLKRNIDTSPVEIWISTKAVSSEGDCWVIVLPVLPDYSSGAGPGSVSWRFHSWYWSLCAYYPVL